MQSRVRQEVPVCQCSFSDSSCMHSVTTKCLKLIAIIMRFVCLDNMSGTGVHFDMQACFIGRTGISPSIRVSWAWKGITVNSSHGQLVIGKSRKGVRTLRT